MRTLKKRGALVGGVIGALFHVAWHMGVTVPPLSNLLWEWGDLFANVPRLELIGLHLGVLGAHLAVYAMLGILVASRIPSEGEGE